MRNGYTERAHVVLSENFLQVQGAKYCFVISRPLHSRCCPMTACVNLRGKTSESWNFGFPFSCGSTTLLPMVGPVMQALNGKMHFGLKYGTAKLLPVKRWELKRCLMLQFILERGRGEKKERHFIISYPTEWENLRTRLKLSLVKIHIHIFTPKSREREKWTAYRKAARKNRCPRLLAAHL